MSALNQTILPQIAPQKALEVGRVQPYFPTEADWKMMMNWGAAALKSGMLPYGIKSAEAAAIIVLKGRELGIPFMVAIAHIHVINGKPTMSAEMMQSLARKNLPGLLINIIKSDDTRAEIEFIRPERNSKTHIEIFTIEKAKTAKLLDKEVWKHYPSAMLWSRAISAGLRKVCPEALMGVSFTPEELGAPVDQEGNVIETTGKRIENEGDPKGISDGDPDKGKDKQPQGPGPSRAQLAGLFTIAKSKGMANKEEVKAWIANTFNFKEPYSLNQLTPQEYQDICNRMEQIKVEANQEEEKTWFGNEDLNKLSRK